MLRLRRVGKLKIREKPQFRGVFEIFLVLAGVFIAQAAILLIAHVFRLHNDLNRLRNVVMDLPRKVAL